ncbi:hypothetical protein K388_00717 [Streptomyces sp. KhCrAH-43]|uniref:hypothetical protein n=1 Tax=Streptomyces TaxID=1883 RepID=UPI000381547E|nr:MULTISPECIES: hypothetical protein [unclassified Streptomyces]MYS38291.1 hypothetical protein [Streptomyces sp. SID4920]MYX66482.1 hypothetical protein [Streptomyces sp. SID8373]RAJ67974.1 hypothetical protein K388_00717 [Streptomyces sp. KhCrAH-43]
MIGNGKKDMALIVVRDSDAVVAALRDELARAGEAERPGLERALALAEARTGAPDAELRGRWAARRITAGGYVGPLDAVAAVKALRQAEPGLSLRQAVLLSREAAALKG